MLKKGRDMIDMDHKTTNLPQDKGATHIVEGETNNSTNLTKFSELSLEEAIFDSTKTNIKSNIKLIQLFLSYRRSSSTPSTAETATGNIQFRVDFLCFYNDLHGFAIVQI